MKLLVALVSLTASVSAFGASVTVPVKGTIFSGDAANGIDNGDIVQGTFTYDDQALSEILPGSPATTYSNAVTAIHLAVGDDLTFTTFLRGSIEVLNDYTDPGNSFQYDQYIVTVFLAPDPTLPPANRINAIQFNLYDNNFEGNTLDLLSNDHLQSYLDVTKTRYAQGRLVTADNTQSFFDQTQFGPAVPEPVALGVLAMPALLRRRRRAVAA